METRLPNLYVPLHSFLPQMLRQTMGMQNKSRRGATLSDIPGGGMERNSTSQDLFPHRNESLCTVHASLPQILSQTLFLKNRSLTADSLISTESICGLKNSVM